MAGLIVMICLVLTSGPVQADNEREIEPGDGISSFFRDAQFNATVIAMTLIRAITGSISAMPAGSCLWISNQDFCYTVPEGLLEGAVFAFHFTCYDNLTDLPSWAYYQNAFQDEHDLRFSLVIPLAR